MKIAIGLFVGLVVMLLLAPLWGVLAALAFDGVVWTGQLVSTGRLTDGMLAFRAGVIIGGALAVLSLLRVAWVDRDWSYVFAALLLVVGFSLLLIATGKSPLRSVPATTTPEDAGNTLITQGAGPPEWHSRSAYERDAAAKVVEIARAGARGNLQQADVAMEELGRWSSQRLRASSRSERLDHDMAKTRFYAVLDADPDPGNAPGLRRAYGEAVTAMWAAVPDVGVGGVQLLAHRQKQLNSAMRLHAASAESANPDASLNTQLGEIVSLQEALLSYEPNTPALWESYAAMVVDSDEELAFGALVTAEQLLHKRSAEPAQPALIETYQRMMRTELQLHASLLPDTSIARLRILKARVAALPWVTVRGNTHEGESDGHGRTRASSEQALPQARGVVTGRGLKADGLLSPPSVPNMFASRGEVIADLPASGFAAMQSAVTLPYSGVAEETYLVLAIDVLKGGVITSVLIEHSSGDPALDAQARNAARGWRPVGGIAPSGERRRVAVVFKPAQKPVEIEQPAVERPEGVSTSQFLGMLLAAKARSNPVRYPRQGLSEPAEGRVLLSITLSGDGRVQAVQIVESSGSTALDKAARDAALRWHVRPGASTADVDLITLRLPVEFRSR